MAQRVSYLGSSGDARKSSSQEYSPAQAFWCLGNSPRLRPDLLLFRRGGGVSLSSGDPPWEAPEWGSPDFGPTLPAPGAGANPGWTHVC